MESYTAYSQLEHNKARDLVAEAIELAEQCSDDVVLAFVLHGAGQHRFIAARESASADKASAGANEALALFERALPVAIAADAHNLSRVIEFNRMRTWMLLGRAVECVAPLQAMLRDCQARGLTHVEFAVRATLASALRTIGNPREALRLTTAGLALARRHGCVNQAVQYLRRERDLAFDALGQTRQDTEPAFLARADAYIEADLESPSLVAMAAHCGVSTRTLQLAFRRHRGLSPISVARNARLEMAANALAEGGQSVKDIARRFGFGSVTTFANEFKRRFGMTPRQRLREQSR